jgi:conjugal transfer pilus assembly protein TraW
VLLVLLALSFDVIGNDLGSIGETYPVKELDMIEYLKERASKLNSSGRMDTINDMMSDSAESYAMRPPGMKLPRAEKYRAVEYTPMIVLSEDLKDHEGRVIHKAGKTVNALEHVSLSTPFCFIDGDDEKQVEWIAHYCPNDINYKVILVDGPILELIKKTNRRLYFDQNSVLVKRLNISSLPAVLRQSDKVLYVEEFPVK